jgi:hypothetical protein
MKTSIKTIVGLPIILLTLAACEGGTDFASDFGPDSKPLGELKAGIWVDPNGCEHWIIDDGVEGYLSQRLQKNGKPVCGSPLTPEQVQGNFKRGSNIPDIF